MDYRELLIKYMAHIIAIEGMDYMDYMGYDYSTISGLSKEDKIELRKLVQDAESRLPKSTLTQQEIENIVLGYILK